MQTTTYKLNVTPGGVPLTIHISQYDVGLRQYTFQPYTTVGEFSYVSGATVTLEATKPDGYAVIHECDYNQDGSITYTVQAQLAAKPGRVWSKVVIRDGSDVLGTGAIIWVVDYAGVKDNAIISDSDISALQQWMDDVEDYAEQADGSAQAAASAVSLAESAAASAQEAATQAAGYVDQAVILGGTPLVAATVSAMTNHDRVYVYTGSETGYTAGNWYYWNGSAWTSGGIYNSSAVQTDPTLSVSGMAADAAATGELKNDCDTLGSIVFNPLEFKQGYWGIADGKEAGGLAWIRTDGDLSDYISEIQIDSSTNIYAFLLAYQYGIYIGCWNGSAWSTTYSPNAGAQSINVKNFRNANPTYKFRLSIHRSSGANISPEDGKYISATYNYTDDTVVDTLSPVYSLSKLMKIESGYWSISDGTAAGATTWCRTVKYIQSGYVLKTATVQMLLQAYTATDVYVGTWNGSAFTTTVANTGRFLTINTNEWFEKYPNYKFKITFYNSGATLAPDDVYQNLTVEYATTAVSDSLDYVEKHVGIRSTKFTQSASASHSSLNDQLWINIKEGSTYYFRCKSNLPIGTSVQIWAIYDDESVEAVIAFHYSNQVVALTAKHNIIRFGLSIGAQSSAYTLEYWIATDESYYSLYYSGFASSPYNDENLDTKLSDYGDLIKSDSVADSYLYFTDPHIFPNDMDEYRMENVIGTLQYTYNNSPAQFVLCGGDWLTDSDTQKEASYKLGRINGITRMKFGENYYPVFGNHDNNYQGILADGSAENTGTLSNNAMINMMFAKYGKMYYKYNTPNTSYYVFDTGSDWESAMTTYRWGQVDWFGKDLAENNPAHAVIVVHIFSNQASASAFPTEPKIQLLADNLTKIAQAYNARNSITLNSITYNYSAATGKVAFLTSGHTHYDADMVHNEIPCIVTKNADTAPDFDLVYVDYTSGKYKTIRVGNGSNRTIDIIV